MLFRSSPHPLPVLAANGLVDGTWTYRPGNPPPPQWPDDGNPMPVDLTRRILARHLATAPEESRVDRMERLERLEREAAEAADPSRATAGNEDVDVDMMID